MAIDPKGQLTIVEIKVSKADLVGDGKWRDYLDYCDRFFWAVPQACARLLEQEHFLPDEAGLLVADRYDAVILREAVDPAAGAGAAQGRMAALRPPRRAPAVGADRPDAGRRQLGPDRADGRLASCDFTVSISLSMSSERCRAWHIRAPNSRWHGRACRGWRRLPAACLTIAAWRCWTATISAVSPSRLVLSTRRAAHQQPRRAFAIADPRGEDQRRVAIACRRYSGRHPSPAG